MKALKWIGIILLVLIVLVVVVSLFLPKHYKYETKAVINAPVSVVFEEVNDLKNWSKWDPWFQLDTLAKEEFSGPEAGKGMVREWFSEHKKVGNGRMEIVESVVDSFIKNALYLGGGEEASYGSWLFKELEEGTEVTWTVEFEMGFNPIMIIMMKMMDKEMKESFETGMANLKAVAEAKPVKEAVEVVMGDIPEMILLAVKDSCSMQEMAPVMDKRMMELNEYIVNHNLMPAGEPVSRYLVWNEEEGYTVFETMIPMDVNTEITENETYYLVEMAPGRSVEVLIRGAYEDASFAEAHIALGKYIEENRLQMAGAPMEIYLVNPANTDNPEQYLTKVVYPIVGEQEEAMAEDTE